MTNSKNKLSGAKRLEPLAGSPLSLLWDVTGEKRSNVSLPQANVQLQQCLGEYQAQLQELQSALRQSDARLAHFIENAPVAIAMFDREMRYLAASRRWLADHGLEGRGVTGRPHYQIFPELSEHWRACHECGMAGKMLRETEDRFERADGSIQWLKWESRPWFNAAGGIGGTVIFTEDITGQKKAEQLLRSANRTLQTIRDCHEAMLRAGTERELLDEICRIIVHTAGERMAWVGFAQNDSHKSVRVVAQAGVSSEHLKNARVSWADAPRGRGPVGTAIRTGKPCLCSNTLTDPNFAVWRASALKHGYGSVLALPLMADKQSFGALAIYAPTADAFDDGEQLLLMDLANDLAFGISNLQLRAERERLEDEILGSIEREQERIGRDLHDGLCQLLVGAKFRSVYLQKVSGTAAAAQEARALEEMLNHAIEQARNLARGLNPVKVTPAGLVAALQKLAEDVESAHQVHCFCRLPVTLNLPHHQVAYHLYLIAQEAVQNALKHSGARNISITLAQPENRLLLTVQDDGTGISPVRKPAGMGLNNMQARAKLIGGSLEICGRPHGGTTVSCALPVPPNHHETPPFQQASSQAGARQTPDFSGG